MTARGLISLLIYGLFVAGLATRNGTLLTLALPLIGYLAFGLYFAPNASKLQVTRSFSADRVPAGVPVEVSLTILNQGPLIESLIVEDRLPLGVRVEEGEARILARLAEGESVTLRYSVVSGRGSYHFDELDVQVSEAFGLMTKHAQLSAPGQIVVLPVVQSLRDVAIRPRRTRAPGPRSATTAPQPRSAAWTCRSRWGRPRKRTRRAQPSTWCRARPYSVRRRHRARRRCT